MLSMFEIKMRIQDCFGGFFIIAPRPKGFVHKATNYAIEPCTVFKLYNRH